jgi:hypothetical protein
MTKIRDLAFTDIGRFDVSDLDTVRNAPTTILAPGHSSVDEVAKRIEEKNAKLVLVLDKRDQVCGVIEPSLVQKEIALYRQQPPDNFAESVLKLAQAQVQFPARERPTLFWCAKGNHFTSELPCPAHP